MRTPHIPRMKTYIVYIATSDQPKKIRIKTDQRPDMDVQSGNWTTIGDSQFLRSHILAIVAEDDTADE
jgi:hypothetical protein